MIDIWTKLAKEGKKWTQFLFAVESAESADSFMWLHL